MTHVHATGDAAQIAPRLYNTEETVFFRGKIGGWEGEFSPQHVADFEKHYGTLLRQYGYADARENR